MGCRPRSLGFLMKSRPKRLSSRRRVYAYKSYKTLRYSPSRLQALFAALDQIETIRIPPGALSIAFLDEPSLARIHKQFLNDPSPTDVITFSGEEIEDFAGEICVSVDQARNASIHYQTSLSHELTLYLAHGWLHLAGYNDIDPQDRKIMRSLEQSTFSKLQTAQAIPDFRFLSSKAAT